MKTFSEEYLANIHKQSFANSERIANAKDCGCFFCLSHFSVSDVNYWDDKQSKTAVCPKCDTDSVLAEHENDRVDDDLLIAMHDVYFDVRLNSKSDWNLRYLNGPNIVYEDDPDDDD